MSQKTEIRKRAERLAHLNRISPQDFEKSRKGLLSRFPDGLIDRRKEESQNSPDEADGNKQKDTT